MDGWRYILYMNRWMCGGFTHRVQTQQGWLSCKYTYCSTFLQDSLGFSQNIQTGPASRSSAAKWHLTHQLHGLDRVQLSSPSLSVPTNPPQVWAWLYIIQYKCQLMPHRSSTPLNALPSTTINHPRWNKRASHTYLTNPTSHGWARKDPKLNPINRQKADRRIPQYSTVGT